MYGVLPSKGLGLPDGSRPVASGRICGHDTGGFRTEIRLSDAEPDPVAGTARKALPLPARGGVFDPSRETDAMPNLSVLAGTGNQPAGVAEDSEVLSGHGEGTADSYRIGPGAGAGDAGWVSGVV